MVIGSIEMGLRYGMDDSFLNEETKTFGINALDNQPTDLKVIFQTTDNPLSSVSYLDTGHSRNS